MKQKRKAASTVMAASALIFMLGIAIGGLTACRAETEPGANSPPASTALDREVPRDSYGNANTNMQQSTRRAGFQPPNITVINTTFYSTEERQGIDIDPQALLPETAAEIGAQYIWDIFGESIDGMYVEVNFEDWEFNNRALWRGAVTVHNRNTLEQRAEWEQLMAVLNAEFEARTLAGEDPSEVQYDIFGSIIHQDYISATFYFSIDAITGKRIDIWRMTDFRHFTEEESTFINEFFQNKERDEVDAAFSSDLTAQEKAALNQKAMEYAGRHFINTTVVNVEFVHASNNVDIDAGGNVIFVPGFASFEATDSTGRVAAVSICLTNTIVTSVSTMQNDMLPFDHFDMSERPVGDYYSRDGEHTR